MSRIGIICFLGRGHLNPAAALGRRLLACGHDVTVFQLSIARAAVASSGLKFAALDTRNDIVCTQDTVHGADRYSSVTALYQRAQDVLRMMPDAVEGKIDALVIDQMDVAASSVAELFRIPFVTLSCAPTFYLHDRWPAPCFHWPYLPTTAGRFRNRVGNSLIRRFMAPTMHLMNRYRRQWGLAALTDINETFSTRSIVSQLPQWFDFPCSDAVPRLMHFGPFFDDHAPRPIPFPWKRLNSKPLIYASLGTIRNNIQSVFETIAHACAPLEAQLVISLGGGRLLPENLPKLPGDPVVVHFAPQAEIVRRAKLVINCAGLNTTLQSLLCGVPLVAIPIAEDQPGVAARIVRSGAGISVPVHTLTVERLRQAIRDVFYGDAYYDVARRAQERLARAQGTETAARWIEDTLHPRHLHGSHSLC